jgi:hypothetical protein
MRLNPAVRDALAAIVSTLNGPGSAAAAAPIAAGLFVPLAELERRGVQPALAMRALADVGLLVHARIGMARPPSRPTSAASRPSGWSLPQPASMVSTPPPSSRPARGALTC